MDDSKLVLYNYKIDKSVFEKKLNSGTFFKIRCSISQSQLVHAGVVRKYSEWNLSPKILVELSAEILHSV